MYMYIYIVDMYMYVRRYIESSSKNLLDYNWFVIVDAHMYMYKHVSLEYFLDADVHVHVCGFNSVIGQMLKPWEIYLTI